MSRRIPRPLAAPPAALLAALAALLGCAHLTPPQGAPPLAHVRLLTLNDLHGQLSPGRVVDGRAVGSAGVLGAWLESAWAGAPGRTLLVHAGDLVGASPPASALLQDEPSVSFVNLFANASCRYPDSPGFAAAPPAFPAPLPEVEPRFRPWLDPACDVVGVVGNHEFDRGRGELLRLLGGGNHPRGPFLEAPWRGARYPTLAANVIDRATGRPILPPFVVKRVDGVRVGFIGVVTREVPTLVTPAGIAGLDFLDEAEAVNRYVPVLLGQGVRAIVVLLHQGGEEPPYPGPTRDGVTVEGEIVDLVARFDPAVDVVVAGHTHEFLNARLPTAGGKRALVVEAYSAGMAFGWVDMEVDRATGEVTGSRAAVQTTWADEGPGAAPYRAAAALQAAAEAKVAPQVKRMVATAAAPFSRTADRAGESRLGDLVADAQRAAVAGAQIAFTNPGGLRADLPAGPLSWGTLFAAQPFGDALVAMTLTGEQLADLLEGQFAGAEPLLQVSGLSYAYRVSAPAGTRVRDVRVGGAPLDRAGHYRVVVNSFLASGGDGFGLFALGTDRATQGDDLAALVAYLGSLPQPVEVRPGSRIRALP